MALPESQIWPMTSVEDAAPTQQPAPPEQLSATTTPFRPTANDDMASNGRADNSDQLDWIRTSSIDAEDEAREASGSRTSTAPVYGARNHYEPSGSNTTMTLHSPAPTAGAIHGAWAPSPVFSNFINATRHQPLPRFPESGGDNDLSMAGTAERFDFTAEPNNNVVTAEKHNRLRLGPVSSRPLPPKRIAMCAPQPSPAVHIFRQVVDLDHAIVTKEALQEAMELGASEMSLEVIHELRRTFTSAKEVEALLLFLSVDNVEKFQSADIDVGPTASWDSAASAEQHRTTRVEGISALSEPLSNRGESSLEARGHSNATQLLRRIDPGAPTFPTFTPPSNEESLVRDVSVVEDGSFEIPRVPSPTPELPKFRKFMVLPPELRERIYELALYTGQAIHPHLCGRKANRAIKFHDDNQHSRQYPNHNAINESLGVTYVSKQVRAESLPCFYSANTFSVGADTATYFAHLERMDRFHIIRHVSFSIPLLNEKWTAQSLEQFSTYLRNVEIYERDHPHTKPYVITPTLREYGMVYDAEVYTNLVEHPRHLAGGLNEMALFICLGMLSSAFTSSSNSAKYTSSIVLPVPSASEFTSCSRLQWFSYVSHGLGIHLHFVEGYELAYNQQAVIGVVWHQRFQKKDFKQLSKKEDAGSVTKRVEDMFPDMELAERKVWNSCSYMRTSCDGDRYTWFTVRH